MAIPARGHHDERHNARHDKAGHDNANHDTATQRCDDVDRDAGRCQLQGAHSAPHAACVGDAYLTWDDGKLSGWSIQRPPSWLMYLSWAPGFHPVIPGEIELDNGRDPAIKHFWHLGRNRRNERQRRKAAGPPNQQLHGA